jgi:D-alanyl-D-alanine carboxypeptidase
MTASASSVPSVTTTASAPSMSWATTTAGEQSRTSCPRDTTRTQGLCVAHGAKAHQAANLVLQTFRDRAVGAITVGVWQKDKPVVVGALGDSLPGVLPATVDMHHVAGNICTPMLTTVLLQQVEAGKLALTDKLAKWFPEIPGANAVTIDNLAHMTSGYTHYPPLEAFQKAFYADPFRVWKPADVISYGVAGGPQYRPGTSANFSDTNTLILGEVLAKVTGRPVPQLLKQGIWDRLGMKNTVSVLDPIPGPVLHSFTGERGVWEEATFWNRSWTSWAGGCASNQDDIRKFIEAVGSGKLLSKASHKLQLAPTTVGLGNNVAKRYWALGVAVVNGWVFTNPGLQGLHAGIGNLPGKKLTIVVYNTLTPKSDPDSNAAQDLMVAISELLSPNQPAKP